ncbi:DUF2726 domain-containing protein [Kushneria indalinina]|uniref:Uncharacterized protein DUF2726 n=1 Tax=Kushneria indalinina DSM 14324 TaxID=1122140 RepID=A0A3D9E0U5_9GAMM|nr:DUF2726 domain-containing protein [Kushneria indalinina]REC96670.1 uncharacterized protein DUF2726 [Kushneria indalinina DSM 14324]
MELPGLPLLAVVVIALIFLKLKSGGKFSGSGGKTRAMRTMSKGGAYVQKARFMSPPEARFFQKLQKEFGQDYLIFSQVRLVDVVVPNTKRYASGGAEYLSLFRQISQWHVDFVIVCKKSYQVVRAYELDDKTHNRPDRQRRDKIYNSVMLDAGVDFYRVNSETFEGFRAKDSKKTSAA